MFKFLKKFKEKILIALACSFIGIGTILCNTLETKAYTSDTFSYSITSETYNNTIYYKVNSDYVYTTYNFLLLNFTTSDNGRWTFRCSFYDSNFNLITYNQNNVYFSSSGVNFYYYNLDLSSYSYFNFYTTASNFNIVNLDYVNQNDLTTMYYASTYIDNYTSLQSQYDSLLLDYQNYQNTHAYTNEQYNSLISQNATLTQQVQSLQSQYDTYVSLHTYTNEQYEQLLINYNTLQNMYGQLQSDYLDLQQSYNALLKDLNPFDTSIWVNRTASLNDYVFDVSSSGSYYNSVVWFRGSYIQIDQREMETFDSFIEGDNHFHFVSESTSEIVLPSFDVIANFSHSLDYGFSVEFYLNNSIVYSSIIFHSDMTTSDNSTTNFFQYNSSLTFNKIVIDVYGGPGPSSWTESSYFRGEPGTWQNGYDYALGQLMPRINQLESDLQESNAQQQVKYSEGFNAGFESRIILNLYME